MLLPVLAMVFAACSQSNSSSSEPANSSSVNTPATSETSASSGSSAASASSFTTVSESPVTPAPDYETEHEGTEQDPFSVADARKVAEATGETATTQKFYIKGVVASVDVSGVAQYGNATYKIKDENGTDLFTCFQVYYLDGAKFDDTTKEAIAVGDTVVVYGAIVNYKGNTPETVGQGSSHVVSVEKGEFVPPEYDTEHEGTKEDPFSVADAIKVAETTGEAETASKYYIKGVVTEANTSGVAQYGNANYKITDEGGTDVFTCFQVYYLDGAKFDDTTKDAIAVGDTIVVYGAIVNYKGNTPETVGKGSSYVVSVEKGEYVPPVVDDGNLGTEEQPLTASEAKTYTSSLASGAYSSAKGYVKGIVIASTYNASYNNYELKIGDTFDASDVFTVYRSENVTEESLLIGDEIVATGYYQNYNGTTPEMTYKDTENPQIISINHLEYDISVSAENATVTGLPESGKAANGTEIALTVTAETDYQIVSVKVGTTVIEENEGVYKVTVQGPTNVVVKTIGIDEVPVIESVSYDFTSIPSGSNELTADGLKQYFDDKVQNGESIVTEVTAISKMYPANNTQGPKLTGLKSGTKNMAGSFTVTTSVAVKSIVINCSTWGASDKDTVSVNDSDPVIAGLGVYQELTFDLGEGVNTIKFDFNNRVVIGNITFNV